MKTIRKTQTVQSITFSMLFLFCLGTLTYGQGQLMTDEGPEHHLMFLPDDIEWQEGPPSLEKGAKIAVLEGKPGESGVFTLRLKLPDGYIISPHSHPNVERLTVLSGTFLLGSGEKLSRETTERLEAGSYTAMPPKMTHFGIVEGETVIQLTSVGPWEINYVNPEDDPRQRQSVE